MRRYSLGTIILVVLLILLLVWLLRSASNPPAAPRYAPNPLRGRVRGKVFRRAGADGPSAAPASRTDPLTVRWPLQPCSPRSALARWWSGCYRLRFFGRARAGIPRSS